MQAGLTNPRYLYALTWEMQVLLQGKWGLFADVIKETLISHLLIKGKRLFL
jgi:hypothetical protein